MDDVKFEILLCLYFLYGKSIGENFTAWERTIGTIDGDVVLLFDFICCGGAFGDDDNMMALVLELVGNSGDGDSGGFFFVVQ